jgi:hypothetical protein
LLQVIAGVVVTGDKLSLVLWPVELTDGGGGGGGKEPNNMTARKPGPL